MAITVSWDNTQKTIIRQVYSPLWDWNEYLASFQKIDELAGEVAYPVGIIAEVGSVKQVPPNAIMYGSRAISNLPSNVVLCVVVTPSQLVKSILKAILTVTQFDKVAMSATVEKARLLIDLKRNYSHYKPK